MVGTTLRGEFREIGKEALPEALVELARKLDEQRARGPTEVASPTQKVSLERRRQRRSTTD